jgi:hypothetical protein
VARKQERLSRFSVDRREAIPWRIYRSWARSVPEEDHTPLGRYGRVSHQAALLTFTSIESNLDLLSGVSALVRHRFLGKVPSMELLCHESSLP